jgi:hypothetical protein
MSSCFSDTICRSVRSRSFSRASTLASSFFTSAPCLFGPRSRNLEIGAGAYSSTLHSTCWLTALTPGSNGIVPKDVCFLLQLSKTVLENIADTDNSDELVAIFDGHMANAVLGHQLHHVGHAVLR